MTSYNEYDLSKIIPVLIRAQKTFHFPNHIREMVRNKGNGNVTVVINEMKCPSPHH